MKQTLKRAFDTPSSQHNPTNSTNNNFNRYNNNNKVTNSFGNRFNNNSKLVSPNVKNALSHFILLPGNLELSGTFYRNFIIRRLYYRKSLQFGALITPKTIFKLFCKVLLVSSPNTSTEKRPVIMMEYD